MTTGDKRMSKNDGGPEELPSVSERLATLLESDSPDFKRAQARGRGFSVGHHGGKVAVRVGGKINYAQDDEEGA